MVEYLRQLNKYYHATLCTGIKTKYVLASNINMLNDLLQEIKTLFTGQLILV